MKLKKRVLIPLIILIIAIIGGIFGYIYLNDKNRLTVEENEWLNTNKNTVISLNVINDLNVFGKSGQGVYYDFLDSFSEEYEIQINPVTFNINDAVSGLSLGYFYDKTDNTPFYTDSFVLVSKSEENINDFNALANVKLLTLSSYKDVTQKYITNKNLEIETKETEEELFNEFKNTNEAIYLLVPKMLYLDDILSNDYHIIYHLSDAKIYYGLINDGSMLYNILSKYYISWSGENFEDSFNTKELSLFTTNLNISSSDIDSLRSNTYNYGVVNNYPYEIISGGTYGGINAVYIKKFADFAKINFDFVKMKNKEKLAKEIKNNKVNLFFDFYDDLNKYNTVNSRILLDYAVIVTNDDPLVVNSLISLENNEVYVEEDSLLLSYLKSIKGLKIKKYSTKDLKKVASEDKIIIMDISKFESLKDSILSDYSIRYTEKTNNSYKYRVDNSTMATLMSRYFETLDNNEMNYLGINNYLITKKNGLLMGSLARYVLILLAIFVLLLIIVYKKSKKIKIAKKIKKEDKMRFIDQLTSLKNRNYLTENLENWNKNTIYPQAIIMLDLNRLQEINDTLGYEQGDDQIRAVANVLIKTQLDRTDIIRTNGNEFLIYLVGYEVKQITSYIHKLNKEFKKLPFDYGVAIGYSMITDDVKSIEDATNEAVEQLKEQKENKKDE